MDDQGLVHPQCRSLLPERACVRPIKVACLQHANGNVGTGLVNEGSLNQDLGVVPVV
jgi:hypothetical protein